MGLSNTLTALAILSTTGWAQYVLQDDYMQGDFFSKFSFWDTSDPTNGFVQYQDYQNAQSSGLISISSDSVEMKVADTGITPNGRPSVRITSTESYDSGLVVIDVEHMPGGVCGTWPAFWMVGPNWPAGGEIDIIEGVNQQSTNQMTLHTGPGCSISNSGSAFSGNLITDNCDINAPGQGTNQGCSIGTGNSNTYGAGFNANGGGVYATEITSSYIAIWFFPRDSIPSDVESDSPNPANWGEPIAKFQGDCDITDSFSNLQLVFDTTLCGDWAGEVWGSSSCSSQASTCEAFVANNPSAFTDAYWTVNALKVYSANGGSSPAPTSSVSVVSSPYPVSSAVSSSVWTSTPIPTTFAISASPSKSLPWSPPVSIPTETNTWSNPWAPIVTGTGPLSIDPISNAPASTAPAVVSSSPAIASSPSAISSPAVVSSPATVSSAPSTPSSTPVVSSAVSAITISTAPTSAPSSPPETTAPAPSTSTPCETSATQQNWWPFPTEWTGREHHDPNGWEVGTHVGKFSNNNIDNNIDIDVDGKNKNEKARHLRIHRHGRKHF